MEQCRRSEQPLLENSGWWALHGWVYWKALLGSVRLVQEEGAVQVRVLKIDAVRQRLGLSLRQAQSVERAR
ncbi:hypothetical protein ACFLUM_03510 [Chloroflexota bacterium]